MTASLCLPECMPGRMALALGLLAAIATGPVWANDSSATMGAGGLILTTSSLIRMESEHLEIGADEIRVSYRFRNTGEQDISTLVAFPLPDLDFDGDWNYDIETDDPVNWIGFSVMVDGKPVDPQVQARASRNGVDVTPVLQKYDIPITLLGGLKQIEPLEARLEALPPEAKAELLRYGVIDWTSAWGAGMAPLPTMHWTSQITFYWFQNFPAGRVVEVEHRYKPVAGLSFVSRYELDEGIYKREFCMSDREAKQVRERMKRSEAGMMRGIELRYVLVTAGNWMGSIGDFSMTIDKGDAQTLLATCWKGLVADGPRLLRYSEKNFQPEGDLRVLMIKPLEDEQ